MFKKDYLKKQYIMNFSITKAFIIIHNILLYTVY